MSASVQVDCVLKIRGGGGPTGECPVWAADEQVLYWVDIAGHALNRFDPATGRNEYRDIGEPIGCYALCERGGFVIGTRSGLHFLDGFATGAKRLICAPESDRPGNRANDGRCDRDGRFWVGTMGDPPDPARPAGAFYRLGTDLSCARQIDGLFVSNGIAFSPDGRTLYQSDSFPSVRTIWAWDLDRASGAVSNRRVFATTQGLEGRPDGGCCDADGCYWSAHIDGWQVARYAPDGRIERVIRLPVRWPTMCAFGGRDYDTLYITSLRRGGASADYPDQPLAGSLFACHPGVRGLPEPRFRG